MKTGSGAQKILKLRAALIGFHRVPGSHSGQHLSAAMMFVIDRVGIAKLVSSILSTFPSQWTNFWLRLDGSRWTMLTLMTLWLSCCPLSSGVEALCLALSVRLGM